MGLGNTGVDLQHRLSQALKFFVKEKFDKSQVYIHWPSENNFFLYCVVIKLSRGDVEFKSSALGKNLYVAYIKALCELGENIICRRDNIQNRSGIAGGFFKANSFCRAKAELIERDAFLYHYRNMIPFKFLKRSNGYDAYQLISIDPCYHVTLVMNSDYVGDNENCLKLGMGCEKDISDSIEKAHNEYSGMYLNHKIFSKCDISDLYRKEWDRKTDFHHSQSMSLENKAIFRILCRHNTKTTSRIYDSSLWSSRLLDSPLRFFKYIKVDHPQVEKINFGEPEKFKQFEKLVYHPFW